MARLTDLSDDILVLVIASLESARDVRALSLACRGIHAMVDEEGWRVFVRTRFPSLSLPSTAGDGWRRLADSLTWQSRSWDRRSLQFSSLLPRRRAARPSRSAAGAFQPVIDAVLCPETGRELVVWAEGEDVVACYRPRGDAKSEASWHRCEGKEFGYVPGYDDVRAIAVVDRPDARSILTGRDNGDLCLLSAEPDRFGQRLARFRPDGDKLSETASRPGSERPGPQETIASVDVRDDLVVACSKHSILLYRIPEGDSNSDGNSDVYTVPPLSVYTFEAGGRERPPRLGSAKWMGRSMIAVALQGTDRPLQYLTLDSQGWTPLATTKDIAIEGWNRLGCKSICGNSLEPIRLRSATMLLSAWEDGTCRLDDPRTPSPFDAVYQDNIYPWTKMHSLMAYGTERFVGGTMHVATVKVFDLRWPRHYYHTAGLPCCAAEPFPPPTQPFTAPPASTHPLVCCSPLVGRRCRWHELSRDIYYRPNASFFLSRGLPDVYESARVWSLARASDASPNFYVGVSGGLLEADLETVEPDGSRGHDPYRRPRSWADCGAAAHGYAAAPVRATMMETGDGLSSVLNRRSIRIPKVYSMSRQYRPARFDAVPTVWRQRHRLDSSFQNEEHFQNGEHFEFSGKA